MEDTRHTLPLQTLRYASESAESNGIINAESRFRNKRFEVDKHSATNFTSTAEMNSDHVISKGIESGLVSKNGRHPGRPVL